MLNTNIRALFPPGPTVANPYRGTSTLNANAAPYMRLSTNVKAPEGSESELTAVNAPPVANLHFSDPDGVRQHPVHEIANGLSQQAPTRQNFSGPFFASSIPTSQNLTASFTVQVGNEKTLRDWFRDEPNPTRQQDYARSLIATASAGNKSRNLGAIGESAHKLQDGTKYENTLCFVRVYENLFKYAEEFQAGSTSNSFTRAWKPAPVYMRDLTPEGNNSFFGENASAFSHFLRGSSHQYSSFQASPLVPWGAGGRSSLTAAKFRHRALADSGFGGPISDMF